MTTIPETPTMLLADIVDHPANPRRDAVADQEMVDSIRAQGLFEPVMVALGPDGKATLIDGHRRRNGCEQAGLERIPVNVRYDLVTEAQQIEAMVVTGLHKMLLTPVEEAAAYEQLALLGMDEAAIAQASGFGVRRVKDRLKLNALPEDVRQKVHAGDASLVDVAALAEFAEDPTATAELEAVLGTDNFQHTIRTIRSRREREIRKTELADEYAAAGAVLATSVPGGAGSVHTEDGAEHRARGLLNFPEDLRAVEAHDGCLAYVMPESQWSDPYLVCIDAARHPEPVPAPSSAPSVSEWEKQQAAREERLAQRTAATAVRADWIRNHLTGLLPARGSKDLAAAAKASLPLFAANDYAGLDPDTLAAGLDLNPADATRPAIYAAQTSYASSVAGMTTTQALTGLAGYLAALVVAHIEVDAAEHLDDVAEVGYMLGVWDWLKLAGYPLSDYDKAERTALEVRHTELAAEAEAAAS